jgi:hypothetical protein
MAHVVARWRTAGQGTYLAWLFDTLRQAYNIGTREVAATAVVVEALRESAAAFCER